MNSNTKIKFNDESNGVHGSALMSRFSCLLFLNKGKVVYIEGVCRSSTHYNNSKVTCSLVFVCFFNIRQDCCYPEDSLGKVLYFVDKAEQGVNKLVSFHIA